MTGSQLNYNQLGDSFRPLNVKDWQKYLSEERELFFVRFNKPINETPKNEFAFLKILGSGSFGKVYLTKHKQTQIYHATKIIKKSFLKIEKNEKHIKNEQNLLSTIRFPFAINLDYFLQDDVQIYFVMPFILGGELFDHLQRNGGKINEEDAKFYSAQVVLVLEYLHYMDIIHRDLKPENVLIDHTGYIKLIDFGFCKKALRTYSFCGTPEYLAPEIILHKGYGKAVDWWALGIFIYDIISGKSPFYIPQNLKATYNNIIIGHFITPNHFSNNVKHLIKNLLQTDTTKRYGNMRNGILDIKEHLWFQDIDWLSLLDRKIKPPFVPKVNNIEDILMFK